MFGDVFEFVCRSVVVPCLLTFFDRFGDDLWGRNGEKHMLIVWCFFEWYFLLFCWKCQWCAKWEKCFSYVFFRVRLKSHFFWPGRSWIVLPVLFWLHFGREINEKLSKNWIRNQVNFLSDFLSIWGSIWEGFGRQKGGQKGVQKRKRKKEGSKML